MNTEQIKKEFERWVDAGRPKVWRRTIGYKNWKLVVTPSWSSNRYYVISDKDEEIRKAFYDGKTIQCRLVNTYYEWEDINPPNWLDGYEYRIKPEEPVYEWIWYSMNEDKTVCWTMHHCVDNEMNQTVWTKFEPSKRLRR